MSEKIVDARIKYIKQVKGKSDEGLLEDYKGMIREGFGEQNWMFERHETEILERMKKWELYY